MNELNPQFIFDEQIYQRTLLRFCNCVTTPIDKSGREGMVLR